ncbi:hypothetical protein [Solibaculum mannosilyticum]|uniref:hypothetical protein n=1 Tax=Solibaculum mannosilyticum TaxID=2780922 RepID=UPI001C000F8A|nr:hypothetical protein [Solibaculum mannosilyticum]
MNWSWENAQIIHIGEKPENGSADYCLGFVAFAGYGRLFPALFASLKEKGAVVRHPAPAALFCIFGECFGIHFTHLSVSCGQMY